MRRALVVGVVLGLASCHGVRGCFGESTDRTLRGKVRVELVESTKLSNADLTTFHAIRVDTKPPFEVSVHCTDADLAENEAGTLVAWRCKTEKPWSLIRIAASGRHFVETEVAELGTGAKPAFASVKSLEDSATHIVEAIFGSANTIGRDAELDSLVAELRAVAPAKIGATFASVAATRTNEGNDAWTPAVAKLGAAERADLEKALCPTLANALAVPLGYVHAAMICPYDAAAGEAALKILERTAGATLLDVDPAPRWAALVAATTKPKEAGDVACSALPASTEMRSTLGALVGHARTRCPAAKIIRCEDLVVCGSDVCSQVDADGAVDAWLKTVTLASPTALRTLAHPDAGLTLAAYAQGPLERDALQKRERSAYKVDVGHGTPCTDVSLARGAPCACLSAKTDVRSMCAVPLTAHSIDADVCSFPIDDKAHTIGPPARTCIDAAGTVCVSSFACCAPLKCVYKGGTTSVCE